MSVRIKPVEDGLYCVNGKDVYIDMDGRWTASPPLSDKETQFFKEYLKIKELSRAKEIDATFKT